MFFRNPEFWYSKPNPFIKHLLHPLGKIYSFIANLNYKRPYAGKSSKAKVVAIGGITVGGSGKTLVTIALCELVNNTNRKAAVLSRGFGRSSEEVFKVDNAIHTFKDVGDEPMLLSRYADVFVGKDRNKSAQMAESLGHNLLILDDGVTQKHLQPDVKLIVIDSVQGLGNGEMLPLGPNRLNFDIVKHDTDAVIIIKNFIYEDINKIKSKIPESLPIIVGHIEQDFSNVQLNERVLVFCGIGYPKKFFDSLEQKLHVAKTVDFPDHHPYSDDNIIDLLDDATIHKAKLVTTEKDMARIPKRFHDFISVIPARIVWQNTEKIGSYLFSSSTQKRT